MSFSPVVVSAPVADRQPRSRANGSLDGRDKQNPRDEPKAPAEGDPYGL